MFYRRIALVAAILVTACSSKQAGPPPRYAVLRFENLTSDRSLDWMGRAASEILIRQIGAVPSREIYKANEGFGRRPVNAPGVSTEFSDALLAGANRIITGYLERVNGKLLFTAREEDAQTGKTLRDVTVQGNIFSACAAIAQQFAAKPKPYGTQSEIALRDFMQGLESQAADNRLYEEAVAADPKYADAYLAWSERALAQGDARAIQQIAAKAAQHHLDEAVMAKLAFSEATVNKDQPATLAALKRIVASDPGDTSAIEALGNAEMAAHRFSEAAATYGKGASNARPELFNLKAYASMFGGDEKAALDAVREYQKASPNDANSIDSEGDIQFYFGHFGEAEKTYLRAESKNPQFNQGTEAWKAARARLMTGDVTGATQLFNNYRAQREKEKDLTVPFRVAKWKFFAGDRREGIAEMHQVADAATNLQLKGLALAQVSIWELQTGQKQAAIQDSEAVLKMPQNANTIAAAVVRFSAQDPASQASLEARAAQMFKGPAGVRLQHEAVGYALLFAKQYREAAGVWKQLYEGSNPNDQTAGFQYAVALSESGQLDAAGKLLRANPLPSVNLVPTFESLYFPVFFQWRGEEAVYRKLMGNTAVPAK